MKKLIENFQIDLRLKGYSKSTIDRYIRYLKFFLEFIEKDPKDITEDDCRRHQIYLIEEKKYSPSTINLNSSVLKFFFLKSLKKNWDQGFLPRIKIPRRLPVILSKDEIVALINSSKNIKQRTILMVLYSTGMRCHEVVRLQSSDIDSQNMVIHIRRGKGGRNRFAVLSKDLLEALRLYWVSWKLEDKNSWLFPAPANNLNHLPEEAIRHFYKRAKKRAGIIKPGGPHTLRHCFATHLLEMNVSLRQIQHLLGHAVISSTIIYTQVSPKRLHKTKNPLEFIAHKIKKQ